MSHVRKLPIVCLAFLISLATFSGAHADGRRVLGGEPLWDASPLTALWDGWLGWLTAGEPAAEPPVSGEPDDLGPEMDPNGKPRVRIGGGFADPILGYTSPQVGNFSSPEKTDD
jgi:hypothetical protein